MEHGKKGTPLPPPSMPNAARMQQVMMDAVKNFGTAPDLEEMVKIIMQQSGMSEGEARRMAQMTKERGMSLQDMRMMAVPSGDAATPSHTQTPNVVSPPTAPKAPEPSFIDQLLSYLTNYDASRRENVGRQGRDMPLGILPQTRPY